MLMWLGVVLHFHEAVLVAHDEATPLPPVAEPAVVACDDDDAGEVRDSLLQILGEGERDVVGGLVGAAPS